jgi:hypothetical protein
MGVERSEAPSSPAAHDERRVNVYAGRCDCAAGVMNSQARTVGEVNAVGLGVGVSTWGDGECGVIRRRLGLRLEHGREGEYDGLGPMFGERKPRQHSLRLELHQTRLKRS